MFFERHNLLDMQDTSSYHLLSSNCIEADSGEIAQEIFPTL